MPRNFQCPETEALCTDARCKKGIICFEKGKEVAHDNLSRAAEKELAIRRWKSREELKIYEWSESLRNRTVNLFTWASNKDSNNSN
jgi:hypothetical protein